MWVKGFLCRGQCYRADLDDDCFFTFRFLGYVRVGDQKFIRCLKNHDNRILLINPAKLVAISNLDYSDAGECNDNFDLVSVEFRVK